MTEFNLEEQLQEALTREVNSRISLKARERMSTSQYFMRRDMEENQIIESGFLFNLFENATLSEVEALTATTPVNEKTLMLSVISALRQYSNNGEETSERCVLLHNLYLKLKKRLTSEIPDYPQEDGFEEFVASKTERAELENARVSGSVCLKCGSHNIVSKGQEWQCRDCGKRFRKHGA